MSGAAFRAALDAVPEQVRGHGLRAAHPWPLVGRLNASGGLRSRRVRPVLAWRERWIQIERTGSAVAAIVLDMDLNPDAETERVRRGRLADVPPFNWAVPSKSGGLHPVWTLLEPVHAYDGARDAPLRLAAYCTHYLSDVLGADPGYSHLLTYNPIYLGAETHWNRTEPYTLDELFSAIPADYERPVYRSAEGVGRNCELFDKLMQFAGKRRNRELALLPEALRINSGFEAPLSEREVGWVVTSVDGNRRRWATQPDGWHSLKFRYRQAARGRLSGARRWEQSARQRDAALVLHLEGRTNGEIALQLGIHRSTVGRWLSGVARTNAGNSP